MVYFYIVIPGSRTRQGIRCDMYILKMLETYETADLVRILASGLVLVALCVSLIMFRNFLSAKVSKLIPRSGLKDVDSYVPTAVYRSADDLPEKSRVLSDAKVRDDAAEMMSVADEAPVERQYSSAGIPSSDVHGGDQDSGALENPSGLVTPIAEWSCADSKCSVRDSGGLATGGLPPLGDRHDSALVSPISRTDIQEKGDNLNPLDDSKIAASLARDEIVSQQSSAGELPEAGQFPPNTSFSSLDVEPQELDQLSLQTSGEMVISPSDKNLESLPDESSLSEQKLDKLSPDASFVSNFSSPSDSQKSEGSFRKAADIILRATNDDFHYSPVEDSIGDDCHKTPPEDPPIQSTEVGHKPRDCLSMAADLIIEKISSNQGKAFNSEQPSVYGTQDSETGLFKFRSPTNSQIGSAGFGNDSDANISGRSSGEGAPQTQQVHLLPCLKSAASQTNRSSSHKESVTFSKVIIHSGCSHSSIEDQGGKDSLDSEDLSDCGDDNEMSVNIAAIEDEMSESRFPCLSYVSQPSDKEITLSSLVSRAHTALGGDAAPINVSAFHINDSDSSDSSYSSSRASKDTNNSSTDTTGDVVPPPSCSVDSPPPLTRLYNSPPRRIHPGPSAAEYTADESRSTESLTLDKHANFPRAHAQDEGEFPQQEKHPSADNSDWSQVCGNDVQLSGDPEERLKTIYITTFPPPAGEKNTYNPALMYHRWSFDSETQSRSTEKDHRSDVEERLSFVTHGSDSCAYIKNTPHPVTLKSEAAGGVELVDCTEVADVCLVSQNENNPPQVGKHYYPYLESHPDSPISEERRLLIGGSSEPEMGGQVALHGKMDQSLAIGEQRSLQKGVDALQSGLKDHPAPEQEKRLASGFPRQTASQDMNEVSDLVDAQRLPQVVHESFTETHDQFVPKNNYTPPAGVPIQPPRICEQPPRQREGGRTVELPRYNNEPAAMPLEEQDAQTRVSLEHDNCHINPPLRESDGQIETPLGDKGGHVAKPSEDDCKPAAAELQSTQEYEDLPFLNVRGNSSFQLATQSPAESDEGDCTQSGVEIAPQIGQRQSLLQVADEQLPEDSGTPLIDGGGMHKYDREPKAYSDCNALCTGDEGLVTNGESSPAPLILQPAENGALDNLPEKERPSTEGSPGKMEHPDGGIFDVDQDPPQSTEDTGVSNTNQGSLAGNDTECFYQQDLTDTHAEGENPVLGERPAPTEKEGDISGPTHCEDAGQLEFTNHEKQPSGEREYEHTGSCDPPTFGAENDADQGKPSLEMDREQVADDPGQEDVEEEPFHSNLNVNAKEFIGSGNFTLNGTFALLAPCMFDDEIPPCSAAGIKCQGWQSGRNGYPKAPCYGGSGRRDLRGSRRIDGASGAGAASSAPHLQHRDLHVVGPPHQRPAEGGGIHSATPSRRKNHYARRRNRNEGQGEGGDPHQDTDRPPVARSRDKKPSDSLRARHRSSGGYHHQSDPKHYHLEKKYIRENMCMMEDGCLNKATCAYLHPSDSKK